MTIELAVLILATFGGFAMVLTGCLRGQWKWYWRLVMSLSGLLIMGIAGYLSLVFYILTGLIDGGAI